MKDYGIVPDTLEATRDALRRAAQECDVIVTSGGVSVGEADYVKPAVEAEGRLLMWRIAMKPGRPLAFGRVGAAAFIGLPGNPVSSFVTFLIFVRPFLLRTQGMSQTAPKIIQARADFDWLEPDEDAAGIVGALTAAAQPGVALHGQDARQLGQHVAADAQVGHDPLSENHFKPPPGGPAGGLWNKSRQRGRLVHRLHDASDGGILPRPVSRIGRHGKGHDPNRTNP